MAYSGLRSFIHELEENDELHRINVFANPDQEITEITDRVLKSGGKALLFENNGTRFPILINSFGSDKKMALALSRKNPYDAGNEIEKLFSSLSESAGGLLKKLSSIPELFKLSSLFPEKIKGKAPCQDIIERDPDLGKLPVLKCWPHDGGPFITLPMVHTIHPETGSSNVGMYRMQVLDRSTTGMHWQRHKTGANHFEAWKKTKLKMPVSVALGGDPVYTYAATAPLPENINEYILAGFLRRRKVKLVKCITNNLYVPADADFIIEGFVDPSEDPVWEGPFGDHTGFYSLADWYPKFHVTCITHRKDAVYPATIVGIPPQEDSFLAKATERIFLAPVKMALLPEIIDFHMPDAGTAHNLVIVKIRKSYPGQGMKVISSLFGAGQMMFSKYIVVVSGEIDIRNYPAVAGHVFENFNGHIDIMLTRGPLDVLDHSSDRFSFGGKMGIDATIKHPEEISMETGKRSKDENLKITLPDVTVTNSSLIDKGIPAMIFSVDTKEDPGIIEIAKRLLKNRPESIIKLMLCVDHKVNIDDLFMVAWQVLANSDPLRDHSFVEPACLLIDGTIKAYRKGGFPRKWPNVVCSDEAIISHVDSRWHSFGFNYTAESPSLNYRRLLREGNDEVVL